MAFQIPLKAKLYLTRLGHSIGVSTKLDLARIELANTDKKIVRLLSHFDKAVSPPIATPSEHDLVKYMEQNPLPQQVVDLSYHRSVPLELFAGVAQFLSAQSRNEKTAEFIQLCHELADRHDHSRLVVEHKRDNPETFRNTAGTINTFVEKQHNNVVQRAEDFTRTMPTATKANVKSSRQVIEFCALAGAGWQDLAINEERGPFMHPTQKGDMTEMRYPECKLAA
jgi:hypothetical protein